MADLYVQYGCGHSAPEGWTSFDCSPTLRFERLPVVGRLYTKNARRFPEAVRYGDIVKGLPLSTDSCKAIFCSHVLEHLSRNDFDSALRNTRALLEPGGTFRLVLPDLEQLARRYLDSGDAQANSQFLEDSCLGREIRPRSVRELLSDWFGANPHLWMWDERSLTHELQEHGFTTIRRAAFGDWDDPRFGAVEDETRFVDAISMQCTRPLN